MSTQQVLHLDHLKKVAQLRRTTMLRNGNPKATLDHSRKNHALVVPVTKRKQVAKKKCDGKEEDEDAWCCTEEFDSNEGGMSKMDVIDD